MKTDQRSASSPASTSVPPATVAARLRRPRSAVSPAPAATHIFEIFPNRPASLAAFTNGLDIGEDVNFDQAWAAAKLYDGAGSKTYRLNSLTIGRVGNALSSADVPIAFAEAALGDTTNVAFAVHPLS